VLGKVEQSSAQILLETRNFPRGQLEQLVVVTEQVAQELSH
jgi:hypothetical protein